MKNDVTLVGALVDKEHLMYINPRYAVRFCPGPHAVCATCGEPKCQYIAHECIALRLNDETGSLDNTGSLACGGTLPNGLAISEQVPDAPVAPSGRLAAPTGDVSHSPSLGSRRLFSGHMERS